MIVASVEIGVVTDGHREVGFRLMFREEGFFLEGGVVFEDLRMGSVFGEDFLDVGSYGVVRGLA